MEEINQKQQRVIRVSKRMLIIAIIIVAVAVALWGANRPGYPKAMPMTEEVTMNASDSVAGEKTMIAPDIMPRYDRGVDVTDTREFMKTNYSAQIFSRDVRETVDDVEAAVRDVEGRIDNINSNEKNGNISFVIPKSDLAEFRDVIEQITHSKLYTESVSSQNLLAQKQNIEDRTDDAIKTLEELGEEKKNIDSNYKSRLNSIQSQINAIQTQLDGVRSDKVAAESLEADDRDEDVIEKLGIQENSLIQQIVSVQQQLSDEKRNYYSQNSSIVSKIKNAGGTVEDLAEEDVDFMNNVETVTGHISVRWINYWEMAERFSPTPMWANTLMLIVIVWWILHRRKIIPKIQVV